MNKALFFCIAALLFFTNYSFAQITPPQRDTIRVIEIINGRSLREKSIDSVNKLETIAGNVLIREGSTKFFCDSAIIDRRFNTIEAFGNVHINDADSLHTYAQYLKYFGNERLAHLTKNVKLTDRKGILYTDDLTYNLATGIGNYYKGGKVVNGTTVLTSQEGVYYADTKDVYFRNRVNLVDPKYKITADSLLYNTVTQVVTFIGPTYIKSKEANIFTTQGTYDLAKGNAFFGTRSLITDSSSRVYQADRIALDEKAGLAELEGSAVIKDSVNGVIVTANHIFLNNRNNSFLATNKPVMIIQQEHDSTFISADTLFSGFTTRTTKKPVSRADSTEVGTDSSRVVIKDSLQATLVDSTARNQRGDVPVIKDHAADSLALSLKNSDTLRHLDTQSEKPPIAGTRDSLKTQVGELVKTLPAKNSLEKQQRTKKKAREQINISRGKATDSLNSDSAKEVRLLDAQRPGSVMIDTGSVRAAGDFKTPVDSLGVDTVRGTRVVKASDADTSIRYFLAFHHVRIFNDSLQSVCDSLFFSAKDSVFRLFYDPVVWNGQSQVTGDTIYMYTKNKKPERLHVFENGMIINRNEKNLFNQIAGKTIDAYFNNGVIDYARVKGQKAESIYYIQDNDSAYVGMNKANGDVIDLYFRDKELKKVKFINDVHGTMYPMRQIPEEEKLLKNFNWQEKRRPKNKLELFE